MTIEDRLVDDSVNKQMPDDETGLAWNAIPLAHLAASSQVSEHNMYSRAIHTLLTDRVRQSIIDAGLDDEDECANGHIQLERNDWQDE